MKQIENLRSFVAFAAFVLIACTLLIWRPGWTQQAGTEVYASPYMNAARTPLKPLSNGALVSPDTLAYWNLKPNSPDRVSYDRETVIKLAEGVWTLNAKSIVNIHVIQGPEGLIVFDTGAIARKKARTPTSCCAA